MTNAHGTTNNDEHGPDTMSRNSAGEAVQLDPDGKSSKMPGIGRVFSVAGTVILFVAILIATAALKSRPLDRGYPTEQTNSYAALMVGLLLVIGAWYVLVFIFAAFSLVTKRSILSGLLWLLLSAGMVLTATLCGLDVGPLTLPYRHG